MTVTPLLFESTTHRAYRFDPVNLPWITLIQVISGHNFEVLARRYYLGLFHLRRQRARPKLSSAELILAPSRQEAHRQMLGRIEEQKADPNREILVQIGIKPDARKIPKALLNGAHGIAIAA